MDDQYNRIDIKLDKITEKIGAIDVTLAAQHASLAEHIRRTELLESDIKPIKKHVFMLEGAIKFIGILALLGGIVEAIRMLSK